MRCEGCFLTRERQKEIGTYALTFRINNEAKHYRLYYDEQEKQHFVGEKRFDTVHDLVEDGLITMYVEYNEKDYISQMTLFRKSREIQNQDNYYSHTDGDSKLEVDNNDNYRKPSGSRLIQNSFKASECEKKHNFQIHSFPMSYWCNWCHDFIWGLKNNGYLCTDCSFECHKQCRDDIPPTC